MGNFYEVGDLLVTQEYTGNQRIEVCIFKTVTGSVFTCITETTRSTLKRFIKNYESLPYSTRVIRADKAQDFISSTI